MAGTYPEKTISCSPGLTQTKSVDGNEKKRLKLSILMEKVVV